MNDHKLNFEKSDFIKYTKFFEEYRKTLENSTENAKGEIKLYVEYPREISDFQKIFCGVVLRPPINVKEHI